MHIAKKEVVKKDIVNEIKDGQIVDCSEGFLLIKDGTVYFLQDIISKKSYGPFLNAYGFHEGYAVVKDKMNHYIIIDKKGAFVADFVTNYSGSIYFSNGYAKIGDKKFVDKKGKIIEYKLNNKIVKSVSDFKCERALVRCEFLGKEYYYFIDKKFNRICKNTYDIAINYNDDRAIVGKNKKRFVIDKGENNILNLKKDNIKITSSYSEGLLNYAENGLWGYLNKECNVLIKPQFDYDIKFSDDVAIYDNKDRNIYIVDKSGNVNLLLSKEQRDKYLSISNFKKGYALLYYNRLNPLCDIVDKEGNIIEFKDDIKIYDDYVVLSDRKSFIKLDDLKKIKKEYQIVITRNNKEIIKSFESEEERDKYFDMLIQEKNSAVDLSRKVYNEYLDKLLEDSNEKNEENPTRETYKVKVKKD